VPVVLQIQEALGISKIVGLGSEFARTADDVFGISVYIRGEQRFRPASFLLRGLTRSFIYDQQSSHKQAIYGQIL
jgi:hypothetical protein